MVPKIHLKKDPHYLEAPGRPQVDLDIVPTTQDKRAYLQHVECCETFFSRSWFPAIAG